MSDTTATVPVTRAEVDAAVRRYVDGTAPLPLRYRDPRGEHDFSIALAIHLHGREGMGPVYDERDVLIGFRGIRLRTPGDPR